MSWQMIDLLLSLEMRHGWKDIAGKMHEAYFVSAWDEREIEWAGIL